MLAVSLLCLFSVFTLNSDAQLLCDPVTQHESGGQCCQMCGPGTKMSQFNCENPKCEQCKEDVEYRETHTHESKCELQPYCDPNRNFKVPVHHIQKRTVCECKEGFHCSGESCKTCVLHSPCGPGEEVESEGTHVHDTVCRKCANGTFSDETSFKGRCVEHTKCPQGSATEAAGTYRSDAVCVKNKRVHIIVGTVLGIFFTALIAAGLAFYFRRKKALEKGTKMECVVCIGPKYETEVPTYETEVPKTVEETLLPSIPQTPVETEDSSILSEEHGRSENGKIVCSVQENGKPPCLPRQESQVSASSTVIYSY